VLGVAIAAIVVSQRRKVDAPVGPQAVLGAIAETQRDATRIPAHLTRLTDDDEIRAGNEMAAQAQAQLSGRHARTLDDAATEQYVQRVGAHLAPYAHRKLLYQFHYIADPYFVNAFALPGGHVFIGAGLLALMDSEDEMAGVLGHEIEHIDHYHCAERLQTQATLSKVPIAGALASIPVAIFQAGYTKDQEMEADHEGTTLAFLAGYSPNGALRMFETFEEYERVGARSNSAAGPAGEAANIFAELVTGYFRSHPFATERAEAIRKLINQKQWAARAERDFGLDCSTARKRMRQRTQRGPTLIASPCRLSDQRHRPAG
jgi:beta-barrel assembly-enhancing protease